MPESDLTPKIVWEDGGVEQISEEEQKKIDHDTKLEKEIFDRVSPKIKEKPSLPELLRLYKAALYSNPKYFSWMLELAPDYTADQIIEESKGMAGNTEKEAKIICEMYPKLKASISDPDSTYISLKRVRDKHGSWHYRVMAWIPMGIQVDDGVCDQIFDIKGSGNIIYFEPSTACVEHACDDLYKSSTTTKGIIKTEPMNLFECFSKLNRGNKFGDEYQIKAEGEITKQDPVVYVMTGLLGGYSNEINRSILTPFLE